MAMWDNYLGALKFAGEWVKVGGFKCLVLSHPCDDELFPFSTCRTLQRTHPDQWHECSNLRAGHAGGVFPLALSSGQSWHAALRASVPPWWHLLWFRCVGQRLRHVAQKSEHLVIRAGWVCQLWVASIGAFSGCEGFGRSDPASSRERDGLIHGSKGFIQKLCGA